MVTSDTGFMGMHLLWWGFWILLWASFFSVLTPVSRKQWRSLREAPKDILYRRLASGDINEDEFERRRTLIERAIRRESLLTIPISLGSARY
ncbi:MAG: SHOCT domain-containing protein [Proteobacteria bacterium]|nr:SHOCT domain-containing protein [Pseudomonadota bacterium]